MPSIHNISTCIIFFLCKSKWNSWQLIRSNSYQIQTIAGPQTPPQTPFPSRPWWWYQWWCFCCCPACGPGCYWQHSPLPVWLLCYVPSKLSLCPHSALPLSSGESVLILTLRSLKTKYSLCHIQWTTSEILIDSQKKTVITMYKITDN